MRGDKVLIAGVAFAVIGQVVHTVEAFLTMNYYTDPAYFAMWSKLMMPAAGAPPLDFFLYSFIFGVITGGLFAYAYEMLKGGIREADPMRRGMKYGWLLFLVGGIPSFLTMYLLLALPFALISSWLISGLIVYIAGGAAMGKILK